MPSFLPFSLIAACRTACATLMASVCLLLGALHASEPEAADLAFFEKDVRPLLAKHCYECHSARAKDVKGGLQLDLRAGVQAGGDRGLLATPGKPEESMLILAVEFKDEDLQMPPAGKLAEHEIRVLREWVTRGLPMPEGDPTTLRSSIDWQAARSFWSFQPLSVQPLPAVQQPGWAATRIDRFLQAEMEQHGLTPSPPASRREWIRRITFDLTGLPPTPEEVERYLADTSPHADSRQVDRLLASPSYGERWGRYWLDLARYTDTTASWLKSTGQAHLYRDWVVSAWNQDTSYPDFVKRQLATDMLPETGPEDLPALGFIGLSPEYWKELQLPPDLISGIVAEEWEERIDAVGRTFLGLTLACARCHDHKFDPVTAEDYYALAGVFASVKLADRLMLPEDEAQAVEQAHAEVAALEKKLVPLKKKKPPSEEEQQQIDELEAQIKQIQETTPHYDAPLANAVEEASLFVMPNGQNHTRLDYKPGEARNVPLQKRGDPTQLGPEIERRFLTLFAANGEPPAFKNGSGRRELAESIVGPAGPLTARVLVNRVWSRHFGRGIVTTPSNFGLQGDAPSHPALLEDLTARFVANGSSLKWLHREIVLSAAYHQTSQADPAKAAIDPDNRYLWRTHRRRLEIEAWRDAVLSVSGLLDSQVGGPAQNLGATDNHRRTIYGTIHRRDLNVMLRLFDFPDPTKHSPQRNETTTPLQQLFVLNSPFMLQRANDFSRRVQQAGEDDQARIAAAYRLLYGRAPSTAEVDAAMEFLAAAPDRNAAWIDYAQALLASNEFLFVD